MPVKIHGKVYKTVAERIEDTKKEVKSITTKIELLDGGAFATATIVLNDDKTATGNALEWRDDKKSMVNGFAYVENAETSAIGRALAFLGFAGSEIASADEIQNAIDRQTSNSNLATEPQKSMLDKNNIQYEDDLSKSEASKMISEIMNKQNNFKGETR